MLEVKMIAVDKIRPSPFQPRESFDKEKIKELVDSINESGLIQPILVRKKGETYQIIAGERRWRAFQFAKLKEIPCVIKEADDLEARELSLAENWHRLNLGTAEAESFIAFLYEDGKKEGRYESIRDMSQKTGIPDRTLSELISAHKEREELRINAQITYSDIAQTRPLEKEPELRKQVLELREKGEIRSIDLREFSKVVKEASPHVRQALLQRVISSEEATTIDAELITPNEKARIIRHIERERSSEGVKSWLSIVKMSEERKDIEAEWVETATGDIWICPICKRKFRLIHVEPVGTHRFEEIKE